MIKQIGSFRCKIYPEFNIPNLPGLKKTVYATMVVKLRGYLNNNINIIYKDEVDYANFTFKIYNYDSPTVEDYIEYQINNFLDLYLTRIDYEYGGVKDACNASYIVEYSNGNSYEILYNKGDKGLYDKETE